MGQFKPMVKMMTTEPSVILKLKKGGKVASKADGGYMPMQSTMPAQAMPVGRGPAGLGRDTAFAPAPMKPSLAERRKAMMAKPVKKPAMNPTMMKDGGDMSQDKAMIKKAFKQHDSQEHKGGKGTDLKLKKGGMKKYATGGAIPSETTSGSYDTTLMHQAKPDRSPAKTGDVKNGNGGGYKSGGKAKKFATGGVIKGNGGGYATGGVIPSETTSGSYDTTLMHQAKPDRAPAKTGGVRNGNGGGFKMGGKASKKAYATGGKVNSGAPVAMPQGRKPVPAPVKISQLAGTYKNGGKATPAEAVLLRNNRAENASAMRDAKMDSNLKYGSPKRMNEGGGTTDMSKGAYDAHYAREKAENEADRKMMTDALMYLPRQAKKAFNSLTGQGAVTTTEREISKTVSPPPAKKRSGGRAC